MSKLSRAVPWEVFDTDCRNNQSTPACEVFSLLATLTTSAANMSPTNLFVRRHISCLVAAGLGLSAIRKAHRLSRRKTYLPVCVNETLSESFVNS